MAHNGVVKRPVPTWSLANPWMIMSAGLALVAAGLIVPEPWKFISIFLGSVAVGGAVWLRLATAGWELEDRAKSSGLVTLAAVGAGVAGYVFNADGWDSFAMVMSVAVGVALAGALLILMPPLARRLTISVLVLVHFGGIVTAVLSVPPPNGPAPFLVNAAWTYFYRNYFQFMYLNNAYHFYSPNPGPPSLLWFAIKYKDGQGRWVMLPAREQYRTRQDYQRYVALPEYVNQPAMPQPTGPFLTEMWKLRVRAGVNLSIPPTPEELVPPSSQFLLPNAYSQHMISSYARYVAHHFPSNLGPDDPVESVKVYRVLHNILGPDQMASMNEKGWSPTGLNTYAPFYLGEFDAEGK